MTDGDRATESGAADALGAELGPVGRTPLPSGLPAGEVTDARWLHSSQVRNWVAPRQSSVSSPPPSAYGKSSEAALAGPLQTRGPARDGRSLFRGLPQ